MITGFTIFILVVLILVVATLFAGVKTVPQGYHYTVERFRRYTRTLTPGLNFIVPYIDTIGGKVNMMEQVIDVPTQEVITKDNATVAVDGVTFYQVFDAARATYEITNLSIAILNLIMTNIRTVMGSMDLDQLLSHRDEINDRLLKVVDAAASPWGIKITRVEIKDIVPPADLVASMGRQMKAEREKRAVILEAEGRREAAFRDAEARERLAAAEAKATDVLSEAVANGQPMALNYYIAEKYVKALEAMAHSPNQKVLILPVEVTAILGSLAGIAELTKSAFGSGGGTAPAPVRRPTGPG